MARPKSFEPEEALNDAMQVFWAKGYDATSVADLTAAMGINKFSMYDTFGDKRSIFVKSLEQYRKTAVAEQFACLHDHDGLKGLEVFFHQILSAPDEVRDVGCLMMNSLVELSGQDPEVDAIVQGHFKWIERQFRGAIRNAQRNGEIAPDLNADDKARALIALAQGVIALNKAKFGRPAAKAAVRDTLESLCR